MEQSTEASSKIAKTIEDIKNIKYTEPIYYIKRMNDIIINMNDIIFGLTKQLEIYRSKYVYTREDIETVLENNIQTNTPPITTNETINEDKNDDDTVLQKVDDPKNQRDKPRDIEHMLEEHLENYLITNIHLLGKDLKYISNQYNTPYGIIDILCSDTEENYVVIELKIDNAKERVVAQIQRYLVYVEKEMAKGKTVRGIIVAKSFDDAVKYSVQGSKYKIELKTIYSIKLSSLIVQ